MDSGPGGPLRVAASSSPEQGIPSHQCNIEDRPPIPNASIPSAISQRRETSSALGDPLESHMQEMEHRLSRLMDIQSGFSSQLLDLQHRLDSFVTTELEAVRTGSQSIDAVEAQLLKSMQDQLRAQESRMQDDFQVQLQSAIAAFSNASLSRLAAVETDLASMNLELQSVKDHQSRMSESAPFGIDD